MSGQTQPKALPSTSSQTLLPLLPNYIHWIFLTHYVQLVMSLCFGVRPSMQCGQPKRGHVTKIFISSLLSLSFSKTLNFLVDFFLFILIFHQYCWFSPCFSDVCFCVLNFPTGPWLSSTSLCPLSCHWSLLPINFWDPHVVFYLFQSFVELRSYDLLEFLWPCFGSFPYVCALFCVSVVCGGIFSLSILLLKPWHPVPFCED